MGEIFVGFVVNLVSSLVFELGKTEYERLAEKHGWKKEAFEKELAAAISQAANSLAQRVGYETVETFFASEPVRNHLLRHFRGEAPQVRQLEEELRSHLGSDWVVFRSLARQNLTLGDLVSNFLERFDQAALSQGGIAPLVLSQHIGALKEDLSRQASEHQLQLQSELAELKSTQAEFRNLLGAQFTGLPATPSVRMAPESDNASASILTALQRVLQEKLLEARALLGANKPLMAVPLLEDLCNTLSTTDELGKFSDLIFKSNNNLGVAYTRLGRYQDAKRVFVHALAKDPGNITAQLNLLSVRAALEEPASQLLAEVLPIHTLNPVPESLNLVIQLYSDLGQGEVALSLYRSSPQALRESVTVQSGLAHFLMKEGSLREATDAARLAYEAEHGDPLNAVTWANALLALAHQALERSDYQITADIRERGRQAAELYDNALETLGVGGCPPGVLTSTLINSMAALTLCGRSQDALDRAQQCLTVDATLGEDPTFSLNHGFAYIANGQLKDAIEPLQRAWSAFPNQNNVLFNLAQCHLVAGNPDHALELADQGFAKLPPGTRERELLGLLIAWAFHKQGRKQERDQFVRGLRLEFPKSAEILLASGKFALVDGQIKTAEMILREAVGIDGDGLEQVERLADVLKSRRNWREAANYYRRALELYQQQGQVPPIIVFMNASMAQQRSRDFEGALATLDWAVESGHADPKVALIKAEVLAGQRKYSQAIEEYGAYLLQCPSDSGAWANLGFSFAKLGRHAEAVDAYEKAAAADNSSLMPLIMSSRLYLIMGDPRRAYRAAQKAKDRAEEDADALYNFFVVALRTGRKDEGVKALKEFSDRFPEDPRVIVWRGTDDILAKRFIDEVIRPAISRSDLANDLFRSKRIPISAYARLLGESVSNTWRRATTETGYVLHTNRGDEGELEHQVSVIGESKRVVIDPTSLFTAVELSLGSLLADLFDEVLVAQGTLDTIQKELLSDKADEALLRSVLALVTAHNGPFKVVPSEGLARQKQFRRLIQVLGTGPVETIGVAVEQAVPMFADEVITREVSAGFGVRAFSVQALLIEARKRQLVDDTDYYRYLLGLIRRQYDDIDFDHNLILATLRNSDLEDDQSIRLVLNQAVSDNANALWFAICYSEAVAALWLSDYRRASSRVVFWTHEMLASLTTSQNRLRAIDMFTTLVVLSLSLKEEGLVRPFLASLYQWGAFSGYPELRIITALQNLTDYVLRSLPTPVASKWVRGLLSEVPLTMKNAIETFLAREHRTFNVLWIEINDQSPYTEGL